MRPRQRMKSGADNRMSWKLALPMYAVSPDIARRTTPR